jgi:hypothetical protein
MEAAKLSMVASSVLVPVAENVETGGTNLIKHSSRSGADQALQKQHATSMGGDITTCGGETGHKEIKVAIQREGHQDSRDRTTMHANTIRHLDRPEYLDH